MRLTRIGDFVTMSGWTWFLAGAAVAEAEEMGAATARGGDMDTNRIRHKQITAKLDRILGRPVGRNDAKLDRILAIVKEETGCANEVIAKVDRILKILGSPQEFSMNFRLAAEPPQTGSKSGG